MSPLLLESICLQDGEICLIEYHQKRVNRSLCSGAKLDLDTAISGLTLPQYGKHKLRLLYDREGQLHHRETIPYEMRQISRLYLREATHINYRFKWADRRMLDDLASDLGEDEDILLTKRGYVCEGRYANIAFGENGNWVTPAQIFLRGVMREYLIAVGEIKIEDVSVASLYDYPYVCLYNALMPLGFCVLPTGVIGKDHFSY